MPKFNYDTPSLIFREFNPEITLQKKIVAELACNNLFLFIIWTLIKLSKTYNGYLGLNTNYKLLLRLFYKRQEFILHSKDFYNSPNYSDK